MKIIFKLGGLMRNESYNTKQKDLILATIKNYDKEFTVKDIYNKLNGLCGLTTIYRLVDKLVSEGRINKYINKNNITYYEYLEECSMKNHFYLKCNNCGIIEHVDCDCIEDLSNHIIKKHDFLLSHDHIIIKGICKNCR